MPHLYCHRLYKIFRLQLNQAIDVGLDQLKSGKKISAKDSYSKLKKKIDRFARKPKEKLIDE